MEKTPRANRSWAQPQKAPAKKKVRVSEAVESGVEGLMRFLQRYARTAMRILLRPWRGLRGLLADRRRDEPVYVLPLTFLAIGVFALSLLGQTAGVMVLDWIWFGDEIGQKVTEALRKEVSLVSIFVQAIPGMAGVLLLSGICSLLLRPWQMTHRVVLVGYAYALGAQAVLLFVVAFGLVGVGTLVDPHIPTARMPAWAGNLAAALVVLGILAAFVLPGVFLFASLRLRRSPRRAVRARAWLVRAWLLASIFAGHLLVLYGARLPNEIIARAKGPQTPEVTVETITVTPHVGRLAIEAIVVIRNRGNAELTWLTRQTTLAMQVPVEVDGRKTCSDAWLKLENINVSKADGVTTPFVQVEPARSSWVRVRGDTELTKQVNADLQRTREWAIHFSLQSSAGSAELSCAHRTLKNARAAPASKT